MGRLGHMSESIPCNVGGVERSVRLVIGVVALGAAILGLLPAGWMTILGYVIGVIGLVTGALSFCPVSQLLGINTCTPSEKKE